MSPKKNSMSDPTPPPSGKPGPGVFVAMAQMSERGENFDEAEAQYKKALDIDPNHMNALLGYAHLEDRRNNLEAATKLYQKAAKKYPKEASLHNDLGLCYHRRGMLPDATKSLRRAVELRGDNKLYRNNLAAVYVEQGKTKEALSQLTAAHGEAVGNYNLAYLLTQKQNNAEALVYFRKAAEKDPSFVGAQQWISKLAPGQGGPQYGTASAPAHNQHSYVPVRQGASAAVVSEAVPPEPSASPYVRTSGYSSGGQYSPAGAAAPATSRGVQYPQSTQPADSYNDAVPPTPNNGRLPGVSG
jgi:tetratricopeptide (TPR) repeat protein